MSRWKASPDAKGGPWLPGWGADPAARGTDPAESPLCNSGLFLGTLSAEPS